MTKLVEIANLFNGTEVNEKNNSFEIVINGNEDHTLECMVDEDGTLALFGCRGGLSAMGAADIESIADIYNKVEDYNTKVNYGFKPMFRDDDYDAGNKYGYRVVDESYGSDHQGELLASLEEAREELKDRIEGYESEGMEPELDEIYIEEVVYRVDEDGEVEELYKATVE